VIEDDVFDYYSLSRLEPSGGKDLFETAAKITPNICMYLPRTVDLSEVASLASDREKQQRPTFLDVEEQWLDDRCKAISCYFGSLAEPFADQA
jgi:trimethylguanosine synthase